VLLVANYGGGSVALLPSGEWRTRARARGSAHGKGAERRAAGSAACALHPSRSQEPLRARRRPRRRPRVRLPARSGRQSPAPYKGRRRRHAPRRRPAPPRVPPTLRWCSSPMSRLTVATLRFDSERAHCRRSHGFDIAAWLDAHELPADIHVAASGRPCTCPTAATTASRCSRWLLTERLHSSRRFPPRATGRAISASIERAMATRRQSAVRPVVAFGRDPDNGS